MGCMGGTQGVLAVVELEKVSDEIRALMQDIEKDLEIRTEEIQKIKDTVRNISTQNADFKRQKS